MTTIADVANLAGVSRSTVSYALSGKRPISAEVKERISTAVKELGYAPNAGARALKSSRTRVIGLMAEFYPDEFAPAMLQYILGVSRAAQELGYDILLTTAEDGVESLRRVSTSQMIDGAILLNVAADDHRLPLAREMSQPVVLVGLPEDPRGVDVFDLDFEEAGRLMVDLLSDAGRQDLVLVSQPKHVVDRGGAYVWRLRDAALEQARIRGVSLRTYDAASMQPEVGDDLQRIFDENPHCTGVLLNNEAAAAALPGILAERNLTVPDDIAVIGRFSEEFGRTFSLQYSSVDSAAEQLGSLAVRQLIRRLSAHDTGPHVIRLIPPQLIDHGSIAPL
ncbi:MAG: LacI family transcriptional regulator [Actinomyces sp.]|nr:LacI family DNA-binding transcriptional regulator [Actinomyces sp.]MCI1788223.1 LacI family transcriptional regulator [Actinomyces sp.]MCI1830047.1 LacI family transcriptional regulator [Actinomyces sp.]MCI1866486.1 LacI family transcriptional regulator [Actinomyces sp.]